MTLNENGWFIFDDDDLDKEYDTENIALERYNPERGISKVIDVENTNSSTQELFLSTTKCKEEVLIPKDFSKTSEITHNSQVEVKFSHDHFHHKLLKVEGCLETSLNTSVIFKSEEKIFCENIYHECDIQNDDSIFKKINRNEGLRVKDELIIVSDSSSEGRVKVENNVDKDFCRKIKSEYHSIINSSSRLSEPGEVLNKSITTPITTEFFSKTVDVTLNTSESKELLIPKEEPAENCENIHDLQVEQKFSHATFHHKVLNTKECLEHDYSNNYKIKESIFSDDDIQKRQIIYLHETNRNEQLEDKDDFLVVSDSSESEPELERDVCQNFSNRIKSEFFSSKDLNSEQSSSSQNNLSENNVITHGSQIEEIFLNGNCENEFLHEEESSGNSLNTHNNFKVEEKISHENVYQKGDIRIDETFYVHESNRYKHLADTDDFIILSDTSDASSESCVGAKIYVGKDFNNKPKPQPCSSSSSKKSKPRRRGRTRKVTSERSNNKSKPVRRSRPQKLTFEDNTEIVDEAKLNRNKHERERTRHEIEAFQVLKKSVYKDDPKQNNISKLKIVRAAIKYIKGLEKILEK